MKMINISETFEIEINDVKKIVKRTDDGKTIRLESYNDIYGLWYDVRKKETINHINKEYNNYLRTKKLERICK